MTGLVLSGGGVRGSYEVGAYYAFKKCHIKFNGYVGTSIGAFNAAMFAAGKEIELLDFWCNVDVAKILGFSKEYQEYLKKNNKSNNTFSHLIFNAKDIIKNKGIKNDGLKEVLKKYNIENDLRKAKKDFGLVTVRIKDLKPVYAFKEDVPLNKLNEYILGSCYFPIFKQEKIIDNNYYIDGGVRDNIPVNMLTKKNYKKIYVIDLDAIGFKKYITNSSNSDIIILKPSKKLKSVFNTNKDDIIYNLKLGYYDTMKALKKLDGNHYIFKRLPNYIYNFLIRKVDNELLDYIEKRFKTCNSKELIIKSLEDIMLIKDFDYNSIYNPIKVINILKEDKRDLKINKFIRSLKLF